MTDGGFLLGKPQNLHCEASPCRRPASFIYGPECEATTGRLMYLCDEHAQQIKDWKAANPNEPVECKTHGRIGKVKDYLILKEM
jgi:hypothetical protein